MKVLVACEESQVVAEQFILLGHEAMSCDIQHDGEKGLPHYRGDVMDILREGYYFDLMIAHPPCTYLTVSANRWYKETPERYYQRIHAAKFFIDLALSKVERIAIENPIGVMSGFYRKPDQIIQPWQFGHGETKATCLWLKNLPLLTPTNVVEGREQRIWKMPPGQERSKLRSRTYEGIAKAMGEQWGGILNQKIA